ncbi:hypothetical protein ACHAXR_003506 [Thalassiosira sp. AJA248-18]
MVSYENGIFILRGRLDGRLDSRRRRSKLWRVAVTAVLFSFFYVATRRSRPEPDLSLLRAAFDANVAPSGVTLDPDLSNVEPSGVSLQNSNDSDGDSEDKEVQSAAASHENKQSADLSLDNAFLQYLQTLAPIPKKVHMFFPDKNYWRENPIPFVEYSILNLMKLNPDWNVTVYDDDMVDNVIRKAADSELIPKEECDILLGVKDNAGNIIQEPSHFVERTDIARLLLMYTEGGFYIDVDRLINKRMEDVIQPNTRLCLPTQNDITFCQDLMCTSPKNELFLATIREASNMRIPQKRRKGWCKGGQLFEMGPVLYNKQIFIHVFGGDDAMYYKYMDGISAFRELLVAGSDGVIATKEETRCDDGFLVDDTLPQCYERGSLYDIYGMKSWAPQVDALWAHGS